MDDTLAVVALPGADMPTVARLVRLRGTFGPLYRPLARQVDAAVLRHQSAGSLSVNQMLSMESRGSAKSSNPVVATGGSDRILRSGGGGDNLDEAIEPSFVELSSVETSEILAAALSEIESLCDMLETECPVWAESMEEEPGEEEPASTSNSCGLNMDVLFNKVCLALALAPPEMWETTSFLTRY